MKNSLTPLVEKGYTSYGNISKVGASKSTVAIMAMLGCGKRAAL